ncbi:hypothetical protein [Intestinibacter bartlettii]|jgi:hypothetical protein|uniref:hypothetical protein n=1 Tax=Peptostreptococcaceae TaxID=186804 RepID=UPI00399316E6|nr:hypothetical protein [Peptoniphilus harei]MBS6766375.1 hypothetical protein [Clostridium sp.]
MKLDKLNKKMEKQFVNDAKELIAIMQDQFGSEKDFDVIKYNINLTFTVNGEERYIEMSSPFETEEE